MMSFQLHDYVKSRIGEVYRNSIKAGAWAENCSGAILFFITGEKK